jgi:hypothetical protein
MHPIFAAHDVHREAAAALILFQEAVRQETVTIEMALEVAKYLEAARTDPTLQFKKPS